MTSKKIHLILILFLMAPHVHGKSQSEKWKANYLEAKPLIESNPDKACKLFTDLSKQMEFPLKKLALIRSITICNKKKEPKWRQLNKYIKETWLKPELNKEKFNFYQKRNHHVSAFLHWHDHRRAIQLEDLEIIDLARKALKQKPRRRSRKKIEGTLYAFAPRFIPNPKRHQFLKVAKDYRKAREFDVALKYYRKIISGKGFTSREKWYAHKGIRTTYKLRKWSFMKKYVAASKDWARFLSGRFKKSKAMTKLYHNANISYIRTLWTEKGREQAEKVLDQLEKDLKGRYSLQLVYWLKGKMAEEKKDFKDTIHWLEKARKQVVLSAEDHRRILWNLAWNYRRIGQFENSQKMLREVNKGKDLTFFAKTKYDYWRAANLLSMKKTKEANKAFQGLADLDLFGYYGSLAYRHLKKPMPPATKNNFSDKELWALFAGSKDYQLFSWLVDVEERDSAQSFLKQKIRPSKRWSTEKFVKYLLLLQKAGDFQKVFVSYHTSSPKKQIEILKKYPYILFPQPYHKIVDRAAKSTDVPSALIYSIMKQESGFDPMARSFADAFGLMQLLPQVAEKSVKQLSGVPYKKADDLYIPEVNIPLGAQTLKNLRRSFKDQFILSVASYNSSQNAVNGWVKSRYKGDPIVFIEDIPYEETKGYVKLVMRNFIAYNRFFQSSKPYLFPEYCLQGLQ